MLSDHQPDVEAVPDQGTILGLFDSRFGKKIQQVLTDRSLVESMVSSLFYINLSTFLCISLAANGLSVKAATLYLLVAFCFVAFSFIAQMAWSRYRLARRGINNAIFYSLIGLLEDATIIIVLYINATAAQQVVPTIAIVCVCAATFLTLPVSTRLFASLTLSKSAILLCCIIYIVEAGSDGSSNTILVFPVLITFVFIFSLAYSLYLRQIKLLHQQYQQEELREIIQDKNRKLRDAIASEQETNAELSRAHTLREKIIRHIGHDLRQPINALNYSLFNIDKNKLDEDQQEQINIATKSIESANYLIEEVLQIATYKKSELKANIESFKISSLLRIIEREYAVAVKQAGCELHVVNCEAVILSDYQLVSRIVKNYLSNAIRYAGGCRIVIGVRRREGYFEVQVIDNGPGIPQDIRENLFEEFVTGGNSKDREGFGLGLSIVKHLAEVCNGGVSITSTIDKGTRCSLLLPRSF